MVSELSFKVRKFVYTTLWDIQQHIYAILLISLVNREVKLMLLHQNGPSNYSSTQSPKISIPHQHWQSNSQISKEDKKWLCA